jgi:hypothetical protein
MYLNSNQELAVHCAAQRQQKHHPDLEVSGLN